MQQACHVINCESWAPFLTMRVLHCTMSTLLSAAFMLSVRFQCTTIRSTFTFLPHPTPRLNSVLEERRGVPVWPRGHVTF